MLRVGIDFETYFDREVSLKKLLPAEYVAHPRFAILGVAVSVSDGRQVIDRFLRPPEWEEFRRRVPWHEAEVVGHNLFFDGLVLRRLYGIVPRFWRCTLQHAHRDVLPFTGSVSLAACAEHFGLAAKGDALVEGQTQATEELAAYALRDVQLAVQLADRMTTLPVEDRMADWTIRVGLDPQFDLDVEMVERRIAEREAEDEKLLRELGVTRTDLRSNARFAELLRGCGVEPAWKSTAAGGTYAFARTDDFMVELQEHPDPVVAALARARLRVKGQQEVDRARSFLRYAAVYDGGIPVPLYYHKARTGRWTGAQKINLQNLKRGSWIRSALRARPGRRLVIADLAQIEARIVAGLAGATELLRSFSAGDPYAEFASRLYGRPISKETDPLERQIGKIAVLGLGYGCGVQTFYDRMLRLTVPDATIEMAQSIVQLYRDTYPAIPRLWREFDSALPLMAQGGTRVFPLPICTIVAREDHILLPSGRKILYPGLEWRDYGWACRVPYRGGESVMRLWGGVLTENIVQALARDIITDAHDRLLRAGIDVVLQVHDELVASVPADAAADAAREVEQALRTPPEWLHGLPLDCEVFVSDTYGGKG